MSLIRKKFALALGAAAITFGAGSASAYDASYAVAESALASNLLGVTTATVANQGAFNVNAQIGDLILGRTTGFGIRVTLDSGKFTAATAAGGVIPTVGPGSNDAANANANTWVIDAITPPTGSSVLTVTLSPAATPVGLVPGAVLIFPAGSLITDNVNTALGGGGGTITATVDFFDPVSATVLLTDTATLFTSLEGVVISYNASTHNTAQRIDVGANVNSSKTDFADLGVINDPTPVNTFHAGRISIGVTQTGAVPANVSAAGTGFAAWTAGGLFQFDGSATGTSLDQHTVTLTGTDFSAFLAAGGAIGIHTGGTLGSPGVAGTACTLAGGDAAVATIAGIVPPAVAGVVSGSDDISGSATATSATLTSTKINAGTDLLDVCFTSVGPPGTVVIADQAIAAAVTVNLDNTSSTLGGVVDPAGSTGTMFPMSYNGDVFDVHTVNPGTNTSQESILRISNTGAESGLVTLTGVDDAGVAHPGTSVTFTLAGGVSIQLTAADIENGNATKGLTGAIGDGSGKWRINVTAEFDGLEVTSFIRTPDGFLTDITKSSAN